MKPNRRNLLIGLATATVGGGAAFGSGAFSQVEADRTVSVSATGDGSALLAFTIDDSYNGIDDTGGQTGDGNSIVELSVSQLNDEAVTTFDSVLTITNNGSQDVTLSVNESSGNGIPAALTFSSGGSDLANNSQTIAAGTSLDVDLEVDLTGSNSVPADTSLTFTANTN